MSRRPSAEQLLAELFSNITDAAEHWRLIAQADNERVKVQVNSHSIFTDSATEHYNKGCAATADLAHKAIQEIIEPFREFFCIGCGKFLSTFSVFNANTHRDDEYLVFADENDARRCEDCAATNNQPTFTRMDPVHRARIGYLEQGTYPDDALNMAVEDRY